MLHTFALLHDDVMDRSDVRRGRPVAAQQFTTRHPSTSEWFGISAAVLTGDLAFVWADQLLDATPVDSSTLSALRNAFTALRTEMMAGQYLDLRADGHADGDANAAKRVALLKSGRYTVTRPLQLGLVATGTTSGKVFDAVTRYGDALGTAFQLRDDVNGVFGDPRAMGKGVEDDLREGRRTLLIHRAMAMSTANQRQVLERSVGNAALTSEDAAACRTIIAESGALASVETMIGSLRTTAVDALSELPTDVASALELLAEITDPPMSPSADAPDSAGDE
jgi:geranylgeranyl diphosphate synthase type I